MKKIYTKPALKAVPARNRKALCESRPVMSQNRHESYDQLGVDTSDSDFE